MTTPDHPAPAASSVFAPEPAPAVIPLPPVAPAEVRPSRWPGRLDGALVGVVLAFAFLAASTVARNSDLWQHLAAGKLLAERQYRFGADPFAYTTAGTYWANHSWLFDLTLYHFYQALGGAALVVLKALAVVALAFLLLNVRRRGTPAWPSAVCTALALLAMSPRLLLQPTCVSYLFLGVALWLLWQVHMGTRDRPIQLVALPLLCIVWVNMDDWFLLGPALVALFWLGEVLEAASTRGPMRAPRNVPGWLAPLALAVCLLNPHGHRVFTLPAELAPALAGTGLTDDVRFRALFGSPWHGDTYFRQAAELNLAAWAYFALVGLGLASFAVHRAGLRGWRGLVFAAFGLLAAWQVRTVPFFAVVAGPITALNFQDAGRAAGLAPADRRRGAVAGRLALLVAGLGLLFVAWTGWPQAGAREGYRVGWGVQPDPSLERVALTLADWRARGMFRDGEHGFAFHPAVADYCAWFAPTEKGFLDHRFALFSPTVTREYEEVCRGLSGMAEGEGGDWQRVLRDHRVRYLVLYDPDLRRLAGPLRQLTAPGPDWALLRVDGRALIFVWRDGGRNDGGRSDALWFDPARLAFGPQDEEARAALPAAPGEGPGRPPLSSDSWARFLRPAGPHAWESPAAALYQRQFEDATRGQRWARSAAHVGLAAESAGAMFRLGSELTVPGALDALPPALPLLAVRAGRRAVAANPDDADAWLVLGQAYLALGWFAGEGGADGRRPLLGLLRHAQAAEALENALRRNPDLLPAHLALAALYADRNCLDAALAHRFAARDLARGLGPARGEGPDAFALRLGRLEQEAAQLEKEVQDRQNLYAIRTQGLQAGDPLGHAQAAIDLGLARKALDEVLLPSRDVLFGAEGARLELKLLLLLGRADEVREKLSEPGWQQNKANLGEHQLVAAGPGGAPVVYRLPAYDWLRACQAAATGDYDLAGDCLSAAGRQLEAQGAQIGRLRRPLARALATEVGLGGAAWPLHPLPVSYLASPLVGLFARARVLRAKQADLAVVAGLLALERGEPKAAADHFRAALGLAPAFAGRPLALAYLGRLRRAGTIE
jgi:tetratricopeptide (TPR) repeat protein